MLQETILAAEATVILTKFEGFVGKMVRGPNDKAGVQSLP
jgi:hypothetical protein